MRKLLLTLFTCALAWSASGQVIFYEDFNGISGPTAGGAGTYNFPSGWLLRNVDNGTPDAQVSYVNAAWERREDFNFNVGDSAAFSTSYYAPAGTANDWMWTPLIGPLPANCILSWDAVTYDPLYPDGYEVRIMTTAPTGGTGVIGNQITNSTVLFSVGAENSSWTSRSVSLNSYAGQSVYIGFRNNSNDKFLLLIDDVKVEVSVNYDAQLVFADTVTEYTMTPITEVAPITFNGNIKNNGLSSLTNVMLNVNVFNSSNVNVYSASSTPANLAPGVTSAFTVASYTPVAADDYTVRFHVSATQTDQVTSNDTLYSTFAITDTVYARDKGAVTGSLGIGVGNGYLGQDFNIVNADDLTSVTIGFTRGYTGKRLAAVVWNMVNGLPSTIVAGTDTILYPDDSARVYTLAIHGGSVNLAPGRYAITAIEFDSTLALAQTNEIFTNGRTWVNWNTNPLGGWANNEDFGAQFAKPYVLRANFGCILASSLASSSDPTCNGADNGAITISSTGAAAPLTYAWTPNVSTTATASNLDGGMYSVTVSDASGCTSTVSVTLTEPAAIDVTTVTNANGDMITSNASGTVAYQWIDCNAGNAPIAGAMSQSYIATANGSYAVVVTQGSCSDTSACVIVLTVGIDQQGAAGTLLVSPNPNAGSFVIKAAQEGIYSIYNELGQEVKTVMLNSGNNYMITVDDLESGIYMIQGTPGDKVVKQKIVITK
jgi:hypothetical protein